MIRPSTASTVNFTSIIPFKVVAKKEDGPEQEINNPEEIKMAFSYLEDVLLKRACESDGEGNLVRSKMKRADHQYEIPHVCVKDDEAYRAHPKIAAYITKDNKSYCGTGTDGPIVKTMADIVNDNGEDHELRDKLDVRINNMSENPIYQLKGKEKTMVIYVEKTSGQNGKESLEFKGIDFVA